MIENQVFSIIFFFIDTRSRLAEALKYYILQGLGTEGCKNLALNLTSKLIFNFDEENISDFNIASYLHSHSMNIE